MRRFCPLISLVALLPFVAHAGDVYYRGDLAPLNIVPTFDKGYLAVYEPQEAISLYRPDGSLAYKATVQVQRAQWITIENATPDSDGSLAVATAYRINKLSGGGVAVFDPTGTQTAFIDTGAGYSPTQVCFGPDHSIWVIGWRGLNAPVTSTDDYFVLRNYALDGRLLGAFLPRSSFEQDPVGPIVGHWQLRSANDRIGGLFYTTSVLPAGTEHHAGEWIETDLSGNVVRRVGMPQKTTAAFSSVGSLYSLGYRGGYSVLSPTMNSWRTISGTSNGILLGADGSSLVFLIRGTNRVVWSTLE